MIVTMPRHPTSANLLEHRIYHSLVLSTLRNRIRIAGQRSCRIPPSSSSSRLHQPKPIYRRKRSTAPTPISGIVFAKTRARARLAPHGPIPRAKGIYLPLGTRGACVCPTQTLPKFLCSFFLLLLGAISLAGDGIVFMLPGRGDKGLKILK